MKLNKLLAYLGCFGNKCLGDPTRRPISTWGVRWGASRADGVISILIYVSRLLAATHLQYCPQPVNKYRSAKKHTPQMQAPLPKQDLAPRPSFSQHAPLPPSPGWEAQGFPNHQLTTSSHHPSKKLTRSGLRLNPPSRKSPLHMHSASPQEICSPLPPSIYMHPPLLLPKRPPQPETY